MQTHHATGSLGITDVGQVLITARDLPRAVAFYRDVLGLTYLFEIPGGAFFTCGGVRLYLGVPEPEVDHPASVLYYRVNDIQGAYNRLLDQGVKTKGEPHLIAKMPDHDLWMLFFHDTEGNLLALMSEIPHA